MKKYAIALVVAIVLIIALVVYTGNGNINKEEKVLGNMEIKSIFENNEKIPAKYTADGDDINPGLEISGVPENARSLVLIMDDPDAPAGTWVHWVVYGIDPSTTSIKENSVPGSLGINSWKKQSYGGPSPPSGTHRYFFKLYALDSELDLEEGASKEDVEKAMENHILDKAELIGLYSRG